MLIKQSHTSALTQVWCSELQGIWSGMLGGIFLQTIILVVITALTNWNKEVSSLKFCISSLFVVKLKRKILYMLFIFQVISKHIAYMQAEQAESRVKKWGGSAAEH